MSNLSCGTHVAEPSANKDCRKLLNQFCRFLPKLKLPISADAKLPLTLNFQIIPISFKIIHKFNVRQDIILIIMNCYRNSKRIISAISSLSN